MASHLTFADREVLYRMRKSGKSSREIAEALGRDRSTIYREVKRNAGGRGYRPKQAQRLTNQRREACRRQTKMSNPEVHRYVVKHLDEKWSPEQIAGRLRIDTPRKRDCRLSRQTIYNWLETDGSEHRKHLRRGTRRTKPETRGQLKDCRSIAGRPRVVESKRRYGDWEGDTIVSPGRRSGVTTMVERKSQYLRVRKTKSLKSRDTMRAINNSLKELPKPLLQSNTLDNGKEFAEHHRPTECLGAEVYFAQPYAPYQRGLNENTNGLLRQFFPKGADFARISSQQVARAQKQLNDRPRKGLRYRTPSEVFNKQRAAIKV